MAKGYPRSERVEELAREVLGEAISELNDPRIGFVTITGVRLSGDLKNATVFVSVLKQEEREDTMEAIQHAAPYLRSLLGREVRMKHLPALHFEEDRTAEHGERIENLLRGLGVSRPPVVDGSDGSDEAGPQ
ncbi:MAG: 30S ribosome-binding factor RbfA [Actinomycetota bacterium]